MPEGKKGGIMGYHKHREVIPISYGVHIDELCRKKDMSFSELARRLKVNRKTIYRWLEGKGLRVDYAIRICDIFGVSLDYLAFGRESRRGAKL